MKKKKSHDSLQLRLDFNTFSITGPSTSSVSATKILGGVLGTGGKLASVASQCLTDRFTVVNTGGTEGADTLCGVNTGQHCEL